MKGTTSSGVAAYLRRMRWPAEKGEVVRNARDNGAPMEVVSIIHKLPSRWYSSPSDVESEIQKIK